MQKKKQGHLFNAIVATLILNLFAQFIYAIPLPFTILHTNDLHSHQTGEGPDYYFTLENESSNSIRGNYARLSTLIKREQEEAQKKREATLTVDAGDFFTGSLFQVLGPDPSFADVPELEFFLYNHYDAITLGNHEFDAGERGLLTMLNKLDRLPKNEQLHIITTNMMPPYISNRFLRTHLFQLKSQGKILNIGVIGLMGDSAILASKSNRNRIQYFEGRELKSTLQQSIDELKEKKANVIVVVAHSGHPEDEKLIKAVDGIDVFVAGHTHEAYPEVRKVGKTFLTQSGSYGKYLGRLKLVYDEGKVSLYDEKIPHLLHVDKSVPLDLTYYQILNEYQIKIGKWLNQNNIDYQFSTPIYLAQKNLIKDHHGRCELGVFVTSAVLKELHHYTKDPIDVYLTSLSFIRESISLYKDQPTQLQFSDIFRLHAVGFDSEGKPGSALVSFYLTKSDFKLLLNLAMAFTFLQDYFNIAVSSSLNYEIRPYGIPFINRFKNLTLHGKEFNDWPPLIHMVTTQNIAYYIMHEVQNLSYGIFSLTVRSKDGTPLQTLPRQNYPKTYILLANALSKLREIIPQ